jgi:hypothetical protein
MLSTPKADKIEIRKVDKTSGESIDFSASDPGRVRGNFVTGTGTLTTSVEFVEIAKDDLSKVSRIPSLQGETFYSVKTRDGKSYRPVKKIIEREDKSVLYVMKDVDQKATSNFSVSVADVEKVWIKKFDIMTTAISVVLCLAAVTALMAYAFGSLIAHMFHQDPYVSFIH